MKITGFKNIIFDLGGVIIDIEPQRTVKAFASYVYKNPTDLTHLYEKIVEGPVLMEYEKGKLTDAQFREKLNDKLDLNLTNEQFDNAFNALLLDYTTERLQYLFSLKKNHRVFLLSNTCHIHYLHYNELLVKKYGYPGLGHFFEKMYLSFEVGLRKPDVKFFQHVIDNAGINPNETVFIDDSLRNIDAAKRTGIHGLHKPQETDLTSLAC